MEEKGHSDTTFNIYGGTVQILPNATKAELHIHAGSTVGNPPQADEPVPLLPDTAKRMLRYINKVEDLQGYLTMLSACTTAKEIAEVVAIMFEKESKLTREEVSKGRFISLLPLLAPQVTKGVTTDNLRIHIDNAVATLHKAVRTF